MKLSILVLSTLICIGAGIAYAETFTLKTNMSDDLAFIGPDGIKNPTLEVHEGDVVALVLQNSDVSLHMFAHDHRVEEELKEEGVYRRVSSTYSSRKCKRLKTDDN